MKMAITKLMLLTVVLAVFAGTVLAETGVHLYRLGEDDAGAVAGQSSIDPTVDGIGTLDLPRIGDPNYASDVPTGSFALGVMPATASTLSMEFTNGVNDGTGESTASEYYHTPTASGIADSTNWGVEMWVKPDALPDGTSQFEVGLIHLGGTGGGLALELATHPTWADGNPTWMVHATGAGATNHNAASGGVADPNVMWTHIAYVNNGGTGEFYVNGVKSSLAANAVTGPTVAWTTLGAMWDNNRRGFDGKLDEVRLFTFDAGTFSVNDLNLLGFQATAPSPTDGAVGVGIDTDLSWTPASGAGLIQEELTVWEIATGTVIVGPDEVATPPYDITSDLDLGTEYGWRVDSVYPEGTKTGDTWSFYTFLPITEPIADGLQLHLDASDAASLALSGDSVLSWTDKVNGDVYAPGTFDDSSGDPNIYFDSSVTDMAHAPKYDATGLNQTNPTVKFDGTDDWLFDSTVSQMNPLNLNDANEFAIFIVASYDRETVVNGQFYTLASAIAMYGDSATNSYKFIVKASGAWTSDYCVVGGAFGYPENDTPGDGFVSTNHRDDNNMLARVTRLGGAAVATDAGTEGPFEWNNFNAQVVSMLGAQYLSDAPTGYNNCSISEVLIYNRALTPAEIAATEAYLADKWLASYCGQPGQVFKQSDLNSDCIVNLLDISMVAAEWLGCTDPTDPINCDSWDGQ